MFTKIAIGTAMLLVATAAVAQQPEQPDLNMRDVDKFIRRFNEKLDEATKTRALKRAYQLNGDSMVGPTIDMSKGIPPDDAVCHLIEGAITGQKFFECDQPEPAMPPSPFKNPPEDITEQTWDKAPARVQVEMVDPRKFNEIDALTSSKMDGVCKRHGLRKVVTDNGKSWRCQK